MTEILLAIGNILILAAAAYMLDRRADKRHTWASLRQLDHAQDTWEFVEKAAAEILARLDETENRIRAHTEKVLYDHSAHLTATANTIQAHSQQVLDTTLARAAIARVQRRVCKQCGRVVVKFDETGVCHDCTARKA